MHQRGTSVLGIIALKSAIGDYSWSGAINTFFDVDPVSHPSSFTESQHPGLQHVKIQFSHLIFCPLNID